MTGNRYATALARLSSVQPPPPPGRSLPAYLSNQAEPGPSPSAGWMVRHSLWVLPAVAFGWFTWVSFGYIGIRHRRRPWVITAAIYFAVPAAGLALTVTSPRTNLTAQTYADLALWLLPWPVGLSHAVWVNFTARLPMLRKR
jgi:hypothetical protein